jgi:hypothetical protein
MPKVYFTADTHFNHANVINHCARPFASIDEMNREMIARWNAWPRRRGHRPGHPVHHQLTRRGENATTLRVALDQLVERGVVRNRGRLWVCEA